MELPREIGSNEVPGAGLWNQLIRWGRSVTPRQSASVLVQRLPGGTTFSSLIDMRGAPRPCMRISCDGTVELLDPPGVDAAVFSVEDFNEFGLFDSTEADEYFTLGVGVWCVGYTAKFSASGPATYVTYLYRHTDGGSFGETSFPVTQTIFDESGTDIRLSTASLVMNDSNSRFSLIMTPSGTDLTGADVWAFKVSN